MTPDTQPVPYIVKMQDPDSDHGFRVRVPRAYGPNDAKRQALLDHPTYDPIRAYPEEA